MPGRTAKTSIYWLAVVVASVVVYAYAHAQVIGSPVIQAKVAEFKIVVQVKDGGLVAQCIQGCAWKELSFGCGDNKQPCTAEINQLGVGPFSK